MDITVIDIINEKTDKHHLMTPFAKVEKKRIFYPKDSPAGGL
jgi:hypothetical protein